MFLFDFKPFNRIPFGSLVPSVNGLPLFKGSWARYNPKVWLTISHRNSSMNPEANPRKRRKMCNGGIVDRVEDFNFHSVFAKKYVQDHAARRKNKA
jgi:hypothetical protein